MVTIKKINVNDVEVSVSQQAGREDYICLTDMAHYKDADRTNYIIQNWMRLRGTIEFLGLWEQINNPNFKGIEFDAFRNNAGASGYDWTKFMQMLNAAFPKQYQQLDLLFPDDVRVDIGK